jgi:hypothetical protein
VRAQPVPADGPQDRHVHLGTPAAAAAVRRDLKRGGERWLIGAARKMATATLADWQAQRSARPQ